METKNEVRSDSIYDVLLVFDRLLWSLSLGYRHGVPVLVELDLVDDTRLSIHNRRSMWHCYWYSKPLAPVYPQIVRPKLVCVYHACLFRSTRHHPHCTFFLCQSTAISSRCRVVFFLNRDVESCSTQDDISCPCLSWPHTTLDWDNCSRPSLSEAVGRVFRQQGSWW